jgi:ATP-dependent exoDNAse (exonuclease V) alpha subunit
MDQEKAIEYAVAGHNIFLTGKAGTGKTYTLNKIIQRLRNEGRIVACTASTGVASVPLGGSTIHSWAGIGIKTKLITEDLFKLKNNKYSHGRIFYADTLIIDEISMLHDYRLDMVEEVCRFIRNNKTVFGGLQIIVSGDFFQLPPVNKDNTKNYCFNAASWKQARFKTCYLKKIYRQENDLEFIEILNNIRCNSVTAAQRKRLDDLYENTENIDKAVNLYCKNVNVDIENSVQLSKLKSESFVSKMTSSGIDFKIEQLKKNCLALETLILKVGAKVMIIVNDIPRMGYCNGTLGEVVSLDSTEEEVISIKSYKTGEIINLPKYKWDLEEYSDSQGRDIVVASIVQYPVKLAWALTVHKSQGATFDYVNLDLRDTFVENMGYVALSRITSLSGLCLAGFNDVALQVDDYVIDQDKIFQNQSDENETEEPEVINNSKINFEKYVEHDMPFIDDDIPF